MWPSNARQPWENDRWPLSTALPAFELAFALLAGALAWQVTGGHPDMRIHGWHWEGTRSVAGGAEYLMPYRGIPGLVAGLGRTWAAPVWLPLIPDLLAGAALVALLWRDAAPRLGRAWAWLVAGLFLLQPLFFCTLLAGNGEGVMLLGLYGVCRAASRVRSRADIIGYLMLATWLVLLFLTNVQTGPIIIALAICLFPCMPSGLFRRAPLTYHLAVFLPVVFTALAFLYMGWWWLGDPLALLQGTGDAASGQWLLDVPGIGSGMGWTSLAIAAGIIVAAAWGQSRTRRVAWSVSAAVACAGVFAWSAGHAGAGNHLALLFAPAALVVGESLPRQRGWILGLLAAGILAAAFAICRMIAG